jgi:hypothetical protein
MMWGVLEFVTGVRGNGHCACRRGKQNIANFAAIGLSAIEGVDRVRKRGVAGGGGRRGDA